MNDRRPMTPAEHNAQVEAERRAYHERRCRESEGYKRVYEYISGALQRAQEQVREGIAMTLQGMQECNEKLKDAPEQQVALQKGTAPNVDSLSGFFALGILGWMFGIPMGDPDFQLDMEADKEYIEEYVKAETEYIHRLVPEQV